MAAVVLDAADLAGANPAWLALLQSSGSGNPFAHPAWCAAWADVYGPDRVRVVADWQTPHLRTLMPLAASRYAPRHWATLGVPLADFGNPLTTPGTGRVAAIADALASVRDSRDSVLLAGIDDQLAAEMPLAAAAHHLVCKQIASEVCPRIDISSRDGWSLSRRTEKRLARLERVLREEHAAVYSVAEIPTDIAPAINRLESLRLRSWWQRRRYNQLPRVIRSPRHGAFLRQAAANMASTGAASVAELWSGPRLLASSLLFWTGGSMLVALKATDTRLPPAISPGLALDSWAIRLAAARGALYVDFGRGDEPYKSVLGARPLMTHDLLIVPRGTALPFVAQSLRACTSDWGYWWRMRRRA